MSKIRESKKKDERKSALEPYLQMKHLDESLNDLTQSHKTKINNLKNSFKLLTDDVQKFKQEIAKNQDIIKDLRDDITVKNEELAKASMRQKTLDDENKALKIKLVKIEEKFANLEVTYDQNVENMRSETARLRQDLEYQANTNKKLTEEYAENYKQLEAALTEKSNSHAELTEKVKQLMHSINEHKVLSSQKHEEALIALKAEIADLNSQLAVKDEELVKISNEKRELEESKNKIIEEQTYKIHEIERIFEQPLKRVKPQLNSGSSSPQKVAPFPTFSDQPATSVTSSNISNSITLQANASRPDTRQSVRATQNSQGTDASKKSTTRRRQRERRFIPSPINEISDSDSDISHHVPNFRVDINNNNRPVMAADSSPVRGFGTLKRSYVPNRVVQDTSESEMNFSQLKRFKN